MNRIFGYLCILLVVLAHTAAAAQEVRIDPSIERSVFTNRMRYLVDPQGRYRLDDVRVPGLRWQSPPGKNFNFGYTPHTYWFTFTVNNPSEKYVNWYLEISYPMLDEVTLFVPGEGGRYAEKVSGDYFPLSRREIRDRNLYFPLQEMPGTRTYYLRIRTTSALSFEAIAWSPVASRNHGITEYTILGIYYGIMLIMIFYNLFIFLSVRERSYIYYVIFITGLVFAQLVLNGLAYQYLWPNAIWWGNNCLPALMSITNMGLMLFFTSYVQTRRHSPLFDTIIRVYLVASALWIPSIFLGNYALTVFVAIILVFISTFTMVVLSAILSYRRVREARFYLIGFTGVIFGITLFQLRSLGVLPHNFFTSWSLQIGTATCVVLLSLGLADRIKTLRDGLRELNVGLEQKVALRTSELQEANKKLTELDRLKSNFFANISHEIRTPLTLILSPIESVLQGDFGKKIDRKFFQNLQRNGIRLLKLINNLLDFSKIEAGRMGMRVREADIVTLLRNYLSNIAPTAEVKGIRLSLDSPVTELRLFVDLEKIDRVMMNLFSNALKFTGENGAIAVRIATDETACVIEMEDTGEGIPAEKLPVIFDRFAQADSSSTRKFEGTGIGLALAKEFIEMHGGSIAVSSRWIGDRPGDHGSVFTLRIPLGREHLARREGVEFVGDDTLAENVSDHRFHGMREMRELNAAEPGSEAAPAPAPENARRILIVEDNADMRDFLTTLLHSSYSIHTATNGREGLAQAHDLLPDLIISDVMMPLMNGYEMTKELKADERTRLIPVILLTAKAEITNRIEGLEFGADDYLTKPFNSRELLARIRALLKTHEFEKVLVERNRVMEQQLKLAQRLQEKLMSQTVPALTGYRSHGVCIPMDKVGGDFFSIRRNGTQVELFIADVSGHGLPAAFLATITKMALESIPVGTDPGLTLNILNRVVGNYTVQQNFVTAFVALIDVDSNRMTYASAGHFPPMLYRRDGDRVIDLASPGKPLGWIPELRYHEERLDLAAGDRMILYTDGVLECRNRKKEEFGEERFRYLICSGASNPPDQFTANLLSSLTVFARSRTFHDDVCLLVFDVC